MSEADSQQPKFAIQRVYVKDISFESPGAPDTFRIQGKPSVNLDLNTKNQSLEDGLWEVVLTLTITAKAEDERSLYLAEVQQAELQGCRAWQQRPASDAPPSLPITCISGPSL